MACNEWSGWNKSCRETSGNAIFHASIWLKKRHFRVYPSQFATGQQGTTREWAQWSPLSRTAALLCVCVRMRAHIVNEWWRVNSVSIPCKCIDTDHSAYHSYALITLTHTLLEASPPLPPLSRSGKWVLPKDCEFWLVLLSNPTASNSMGLKLWRKSTLTQCYHVLQ
jgi:hypothetical protein